MLGHSSARGDAIRYGVQIPSIHSLKAVTEAEIAEATLAGHEVVTCHHCGKRFLADTTAFWIRDHLCKHYFCPPAADRDNPCFAAWQRRANIILAKDRVVRSV